MKRQDTWFTRIVCWLAGAGLVWLLIDQVVFCQVNGYGCY
jgi:hypothetical protein